jgi:hypothetical protein
MSTAVGSHGAQVLITLEPVTDPGDFTLVPNLVGTPSIDRMRDSKEFTAHGDTVEYFNFSPVLKRGVNSFEFNFDRSIPEHLALEEMVNSNTTFGLKFLPSDGVANGAGDVTQCGQGTNWKTAHEPNEGVQAVTFEFRSSGPFRSNGVLYS